MGNHDSYYLRPDGARFFTTVAVCHSDGSVHVSPMQVIKNKKREFSELTLNRRVVSAVREAMEANRTKTDVTIVAHQEEAITLAFYLGMHDLPAGDVKRYKLQGGGGCFALSATLKSQDLETGEEFEWFLDMLVSEICPQRIYVQQCV